MATPLRLLARTCTGPLLRLLAAPARILAPWSDDADDVWEPFLDDAPAPAHHLLA